MTTFDYREAWLRMANKIRRQRDYWRKTSDKIREQAANSDRDRSIELNGAADQLSKCADDMDYMVQKAIWAAPSEDKRIVLHGVYPPRE